MAVGPRTVLEAQSDAGAIGKNGTSGASLTDTTRADGSNTIRN